MLQDLAYTPPFFFVLDLSDAKYVLNAVYYDRVLPQGFTDHAGGVSQTYDPAANTCITPNSNYALDIRFTGATSSAPEPSAFSLLGIGFEALAGFTQFKTRRMPPHMGGKTR
jgi:hypothetical protein